MFREQPARNRSNDGGLTYGPAVLAALGGNTTGNVAVDQKIRARPAAVGVIDQTRGGTSYTIPSACP
jgi:hypothetical protein